MDRTTDIRAGQPPDPAPKGLPTWAFASIRPYRARSVPLRFVKNARNLLRAGAPLKIAVVGAGFAGLASARCSASSGTTSPCSRRRPTSAACGARPAATRACATQNNKGSYAFSDLPMPQGLPGVAQRRAGAGVPRAYVDTSGSRGMLRLSTEVSAPSWRTPRTAGSSPRAGGPTAARPERFDHLVVANGIFSDPVIPRSRGSRELLRAGGKRRRLEPAPRPRGRPAASTSWSSATASRPATWRPRWARSPPSTDVVARAPAVEDAQEARQRAELQVPAAHPARRGAVPLPDQAAAAWSGSCTARATACAGSCSRASARSRPAAAAQELGLVPARRRSPTSPASPSRLATDGFFEQVADGADRRAPRRRDRAAASTTGASRPPCSTTARGSRPTWSSAAPGSTSACRSSTTDLQRG